MSVRDKVGLDLGSVGFRRRAPGTAVHVENQTRALLSMPVEWDWIVVATPCALAEAPYFESFDPIIVPDAPLSYHASFVVGRQWKKAGCRLGVASAFFAPFFGPPVVTNYFDANVLHHVRDARTFEQHLKSLLMRTLFSFSRFRSRALFIDSQFGKSTLVDAKLVGADKCLVAPCGCPPVPTLTETPAWAHALRGRPFILYTGAFSENKNQRRLIQAWDQARRRNSAMPCLVLIGPCPHDYLRDVIEPLRQQTQNPEDTVITGFLPTSEVGWAFHNCHSYVQPSFAEGFGMPVVEAMSCGVPVACSDSTSLPEIVGKAGLLFDPSSVESMAQALETITFAESERARLLEAGLERAKAFTWERNAAIVATQIRKELALISQRSPSRAE